MNFSYAFYGGLLIGLSALVLYFGVGRIFGISGIIGGLFNKEEEKSWRLLTLGGLILGATTAHFFFKTPAQVQTLPLPYLIMGGIFMGYGTRLGSGCTSGHGVCGISRLSLRSIVATVTFMASGIAVVALLHFSKVL